MVVRLAVRMTIAFEEVTSAQLLLAVAAQEVLRVPGFAQRSYHLANDRLVARVAASLLGRVHTLTVHVSLQATQHRIQLCRLVLLTFVALVRSIG